METKNIKEYNPKALKAIKDTLSFSENDSEPVKIELSFTDFQDITYTVRTILDAIEIIGYNGSSTDLDTCAGLAEIAKKLLTHNQHEFLDNLLIKNKNTENQFVKI